MTDDRKPRNGGGIAARQGAVVNAPGDGRFMAAGSGLTDKQRAFVTAYIANGAKAADAARTAGYADPYGAAYQQMRNRAVLEAIRENTLHQIAAGGAVGVGVLLEIATDKAAPAPARVSSAKWLAEAAGHGLAAVKAGQGAMGTGDKALEDMTLQELDAFINAGMASVQAVRDQRARTIDADPDTGETPRLTRNPDGGGAESQ